LFVSIPTSTQAHKRTACFRALVAQGNHARREDDTMTSREYAERRYREALAQFAKGGNRYNALDSKEDGLVFWGAAAGYSAEDIIDDAHAEGATGEHDRSADIRRLYPSRKDRADAWNAKREAEGASGSFAPRRRPAVGRGVKAPAAPAAEVGLVRWLIAEGFDIDDMEKLRRLSAAPICPDDDALALRVSTEWELLELFAPEEYVFMRSGKASNARATLGENLRPLKEWFDTPMSKTLGGAVEVVCVNPLTGRQGARGSYGTRDCVATPRHVVMEFDRMSLADQCRFWAGVIRRNALPLACLVYSGNKSIHGAVRVFAKTAEEHRDLADAIAARYAVDANPDADPDADFSKHPEKHPEYYRLDVQALRNPLVCVRLAGVVRKDTGKPQTLLYAAPHWFDRDFQAKLNPAPAVERIEATDEANVPDEGQGEAVAPAALPTTARTESGGEFVRRCAECVVRADCEQEFGKFWGEKSRGGIGCNGTFKGWGEARQAVADLKREVALDLLKRKHPAR
jgi:hypothetical protein